MVVILGLAAGLIVLGIIMAWGSKQVGGLLGTVLYWVGVVLIVVGLILLLTPVLLWVSAQLRAMFQP